MTDRCTDRLKKVSEKCSGASANSIVFYFSRLVEELLLLFYVSKTNVNVAKWNRKKFLFKAPNNKLLHFIIDVEHSLCSSASL